MNAILTTTETRHLTESAHHTPDSPIAYQTAIEPPHGRSLSLRDYYDQDAVHRYPALTKALDTFLQQHGVRRAFAPRLRFSRTVAMPSDMAIRITLPSGIELFRTSIDADAVVLPEPGDAYLASTAGCACVAMVCGDLMIAGHAGRDNLIDREYVLDVRRPERKNIIDAMARSLRRSEGRPRASCKAFYSLQRKGFIHLHDHPVHGVFNKKLEELLGLRHDAERTGIIRPVPGGFEIDQGLLIAAQARRHGFHRVSTCNEPLRTTGPYATTTHNNEALRTSRNLSAIVRVS